MVSRKNICLTWMVVVFSFCWLLWGVFPIPQVQAGLINGVTATASTEYLPGMEVSHLVDRSGLNTTNTPPTHSSAYPADIYWETVAYQYSGWVEFDLQMNRDVDSFRVWNFNLYYPGYGSYTGRGAKDVNISTKAEGGAWSTPVPYVFDKAPGTDDYQGQLFSTLGWQSVRYVKFDIQNYYGDGDAAGHVGLSEVRFYTADVCTPAASGLVSWWGGDNNALDLGGTNHGALMNDATFAAGKVGQAFSFDGVDDYVEVPHNASLSFSPTSPMTVDLWAYRTSSSNGHHLLAKRAGCGSNDMNYQLHLNDIGLCFLGTDVGDNMVCTTGGLSDLPLNTWTHIAVTFDGSTLRLFINGQMVASNPSATLGPQNSAPLTIGALGSCSSIYPFGGLLDEVSIYNRGLSASEIAAIYNAGSAGKCKGVIQLFTLFLPFIAK